MSAEADELYSLLVPLADERLIVPRACVAEVVRYSAPQQEAGAHSWMLGTTNWNGRALPIVSFEGAVIEAERFEGYFDPGSLAGHNQRILGSKMDTSVIARDIQENGGQDKFDAWLQGRGNSTLWLSSARDVESQNR